MISNWFTNKAAKVPAHDSACREPSPDKTGRPPRRGGLPDEEKPVRRAEAGSEAGSGGGRRDLMKRATARKLPAAPENGRSTESAIAPENGEPPCMQGGSFHETSAELTA